MEDIKTIQMEAFAQKIAEESCGQAEPSGCDYDMPEKEFEKYPDVMADILNALIYEGETVTKPEALFSAETETCYRDEAGKLRRQYEDLAEYTTDKNGRQILYLIANQTNIDTRMILRKYGYVGGCYRSQYNGQSRDICPVIEIVLYWGRKRWKKNHTMRSFFSNKDLDERAWEYIGNEKLHIFEMRYLPRTVIERFTGDMRLVLEYLYDPHQAVQLKQEIRHPEELFGMLAVLSNDKRYIELFKELKEEGGLKNGGKISMCVLMDEIYGNREKGRAEGRAEGIKMVILNMLKRGMNKTDICELAECTPDFVEEVSRTIFVTA